MFKPRLRASTIKRTLISVLLGCLYFLSLPDGHTDVYKWVDEQGHVHYGDKAADGADPIPITEKEKADTPSPTQRREEKRQRILNIMQEDRLQRQQAREKAQQEKAQRQARCNKAQDRLRAYREAGHLYDLDATGKRRVLTDAERAKALQNSRETVKKWCD